MITRTITFLALAALASIALPMSYAQNPALHRVSRIHVAAMGSGEQADRFHSLLREELSKIGFEVAEQRANADAVLAGSFQYEAGGELTSARATVTLRPQNGKQILWSGDYISQHKGQGHEDVIRNLAETCAQQLRKSWEKSAP